MKKTLSFLLLLAMILSAVSAMAFTSVAADAASVRVADTSAAVDAIPETVTLADRGTVLTAQAAYELLSDAEKAELPDANAAITDALAALEAAKDAADRGEGVHLSDIEWLSWVIDGATSEDESPKSTPSKDMNYKGTAISIGGKEYPKGLRTHPGADYNAVLEYDISAYDYTTFSATVGKGDEENANYGAVQFFVYGDGALLAVSEYMDVGSECYIACDITDVDILRIEVAPLEIYWCDSASLGYPMLSNRPVSEVDNHLKSYFTEKTATEAAEGVVYDPAKRTVSLTGDARYSVEVDPHGTHFAAVATTSSETPVTVMISSNGELIDTVKVEKGTPLALNYPIIFATNKMSSPAYKAIPTTFTIAADCGDAELVLTNIKQYVPTDANNPVDPDPMPAPEPAVDTLVINPYVSGDISGWENWSGQTQLLIRVDNENYAKDLSALTWKITIKNGEEIKTITMVPSSAQPNWLYRFETCIAEGDNQFIPVNGTDYTVSVKVYDGETLVGESAEVSGFKPFQDPIVPEEEIPGDNDQDQDQDQGGAKPTGDAAVYAAIAVTVAAVALAVVLKKRVVI